ncbi:AAA+ ATPase domain-containing protein [Entamoeba marina]
MLTSEDLKVRGSLPVFIENEKPVKKFCQVDASPHTSISQEESLHAIFEKYGTRRISQTSPEEQAMRKQQNDEMWKYIKPHEKEAILYSCIIPFQYPQLIKYTKSLSSLYRTTLLTGPKGSMKFLSRVIRAVADYYDVPMLSVKFKVLSQTVDASSQKRKGFHERQQVKFIGKGKRQREYFDDIELGTRGVVLYVKDSKAAVNFEIGERSVGSFVDVEYLGNINEEIPEYDQRIVGRLEELTDKYGPLVVSIFDIGYFNENQIFQDFKAFLRNFKFTDNKSVIFGTMATPPPQKTQSIQQLDPSLCMIGMKEMRFVESFPLFKNSKEQQKSLSTVTKLFGNCINVTEPSSDLLRTWKVMVADDNKITRISKNRSLLSNEAQKYGVKILQYPEDEMTEQLTQEQVIKSLGHSIQYQNNKGLNPKELPKDALAYGLSLTRVKKEVDFEEFDTDNEFEKKLLGDVIRAEDIAVSFDDIGALEDVKKILNETITLPLVRPELFFSKLTQGAKGVLLFGPPGTGKTMLAKAVATESKSNFINVSMSSLGSKCSKKDENEFMALWDGIKSKDMERVIVMAATNRPFDLDDAVLRRLSRRILVDLPNEKNRETILKKILRSEDVDENINFSIISQESDGFSGSDLFSLCQIVAMRPIKEFLKNEKDKPFEQRDKNPKLRPINTQDFLDELKKISPSVSKDSTSLNELRNWNTLYGEGSSVASKRLTYFL